MSRNLLGQNIRLELLVYGRKKLLENESGFIVRKPMNESINLQKKIILENQSRFTAGKYVNKLLI